MDNDSQLDLNKSKTFGNDIIVVDGVWGVGKSAITPIVAAFQGVEKKRIDPIFEYIAALSWLKCLSTDAVETLYRTYADFFTYHNAIGREVNLRIRDDSGLRNSPGWNRYINRLFSRDGDHVEERILATNPATLLVGDYILPSIRELQAALGTRLYFIEIVRHPLHLYKYFEKYVADFARMREFTLSFEVHGTRVPWFARDWNDDYLRASNPERAALLIARSYQMFDQFLDSANILVIPFEHFVLDTNSHVARLTSFLGRPVHYRTKPIMRRHLLPRKQISMGRPSNSRSWNTAANSDEKEVNNSLIREIQQACSEPVFCEFSRAISRYEQRYPTYLDFGRFHSE